MDKFNNRYYNEILNLYEEPFIYDNLRFKTTKHAIQYAKLITNGYNNIARLFALDNSDNAEVANDSGIKASLHCKNLIILNERERANWNEEKEDTKLNILYAKFSVPVLRDMLLDTGNTELWSSSGIRNTIVEKVRLILYFEEYDKALITL
jgi:predicted NAD-dependent protein-ADP-ribosyltransferase YbiA (DUF1768 family)